MTYTPKGLLTSFTSPTGATSRMEYDAAGRLTRDEDAEQGFKTLTRQTDGTVEVELPSGQRVEYGRDVLGRRSAVSVDGVVQKRYIYSGLQLLAEMDAQGEVETRYVYATHEHVPDLMWRAGQWYRLIKDIRGSVRLVVGTSNGQVAQRIDYDEFGRVITDTSPGLQPFGFAGGLYDQRTQLVTFGLRTYDPFSGRFLSRDPLWHGGGHSNLYLYVANDPVNFNDPDGLLPLWVVPAVKYAGATFAALAGGTYLGNKISQPSQKGNYGMVFIRKEGKLFIINGGDIKI